MKKTATTSQLFNLPLFSRGRRELLTQLEKTLISGKKLVTVLTPNPEQYVQAWENRRLRTYFNEADYLLPDGTGLVLASRILSKKKRMTPLQNTIPGVDVVASLIRVARRQHLQVMIVGGREYTKAIPDVKTTWSEGYQDVKNPTPLEEKELTALIKETQPDIVFVAFGAPWQERWISEHRRLLERSGVRLAMAVGGSFDYLFHKVPRAPRAVRKMGLEWLYRLIRQPQRWRRQLRLIRFTQLVFQEFFR